MKINDRFRAAAVCWVLVPGDWVGHLLGSADPDHVLPTAESTNDALHRLERRPRIGWIDRLLLNY